MVARSCTCTSATASTLELSASWIVRAKYSTRSELAKLITGALIIRVAIGWASTSSTKPAGKLKAFWAPPASDEARTRPWALISQTWRTIRLCCTAPCISRLAVWASIQSAISLDSPSNSSMPASSTSTPNRLRLSAASAPLTKRVA